MVPLKNENRILFKTTSENEFQAKNLHKTSNSPPITMKFLNTFKLLYEAYVYQISAWSDENCSVCSDLNIGTPRLAHPVV